VQDLPKKGLRRRRTSAVHKYGLTPGRQIRLEPRLHQQPGHPGTSGERHQVEGPGARRRDGQPVGDGMLEIWQADAQGRFSDPQDKRALPIRRSRASALRHRSERRLCVRHHQTGGRVRCHDRKLQAPHLSLAIFARGMLLPITRGFYFDGEAANAADRSWRLLPADRRATLIATRKPGNGNAVYAATVACRATTRPCFSIFDVIRHCERAKQSRNK